MWTSFGAGMSHSTLGPEDVAARFNAANPDTPGAANRALEIIRLLALTGCRRGGILNLRWCDIGTEALHLPDSKTGPRTVPLGEAALAQIDALPGARRADRFLFPRYAQGRGLDRLAKCWRTVCDEAQLGRLRLHDLRHTLAS